MDGAGRSFFPGFQGSIWRPDQVSFKRSLIFLGILMA
jgi:hypothetical protein